MALDAPMMLAAYSRRSSLMPWGAKTRWKATRCPASLSTSVPSRSNRSAVFMSPGVSRASGSSHGRPDLPGIEFRVAVAEKLGLGLFARSDRENLVEDLLALLGDRDAVDHVAAIDVHVLDHPAVGLVVGGELDRGRRLAAISRAAAGGETEDVGAAGDLARRRHRVVARRVHEHEALGGDRLGVFVNFVECGRPALRRRAERFLENGGEAPGLVAGRGVVVHLPAVAVTILLPPADALDKLLADFRGRGAPGQKMLGAVDFGGLGQDRGAAVAHQDVGRGAERRIGGDTRVAVRAAALKSEGELARRGRRPLGAVERGQHGADALDPDSDGLAGAPGRLDRH